MKSGNDTTRKCHTRASHAGADMPTPDKGKPGDPGKKSGDSTKSREILFFPDKD